MLRSATTCCCGSEPPLLADILGDGAVRVVIYGEIYVVALSGSKWSSWPDKVCGGPMTSKWL